MATLGLSGMATAGAASPELHIKNDTAWALQLQGGICENEIFSSNGTFVAASGEDGGDAGHWRGGGSEIHMKWTAGEHVGSTFHGSWVASEKEFVGIVEPAGLHGDLDRGSVPDCWTRFESVTKNVARFG
jgi:hypothetical protein